jgi:hypothetical protein
MRPRSAGISEVHFTWKTPRFSFLLKVHPVKKSPEKPMQSYQNLSMAKDFFLSLKGFSE